MAMARLKWEDAAKEIFENPNMFEKRADGREYIKNDEALAYLRKRMMDNGFPQEQVDKVSDNYLFTQLRSHVDNFSQINYERGTLVKRTAIPVETVTVQGVQSVNTVQVSETPEWLKEYIPPQIGQYIPQRLAGGLKDMEIIKRAYQNHQHVLISGPTGTGKTVCAQNVFAEMQIPMMRISAHDKMDFDSLVGRWIPNPRKGLNGEPDWVFIEAPLMLATKYGLPLVIEEINMARAEFMSFLHAATDDTRQVIITDKPKHDNPQVSEVINVHPNFILIGTMNVGYAGTRPLNEAFKSRFEIKMEFDYPEEAEKKLFPAWIKRLGDELRKKPEIIQTPISFRMLRALQKNCDLYTKETALWMFLNNFPEEERPEVREIMLLISRQQVN